MQLGSPFDATCCSLAAPIKHWSDLWMQVWLNNYFIGEGLARWYYLPFFVPKQAQCPEGRCCRLNIYIFEMNTRKGQRPTVLQLRKFNIWSMYVYCDPVCSPWECEWFVFAGEPLSLMRSLGAYTEAGPNRIWLHTYGYEWTDGQFIAAGRLFLPLFNCQFSLWPTCGFSLLFSRLYTKRKSPTKHAEDGLMFTFVWRPLWEIACWIICHQWSSAGQVLLDSHLLFLEGTDPLQQMQRSLMSSYSTVPSGSCCLACWDWESQQTNSQPELS